MFNIGELLCSDEFKPLVVPASRVRAAALNTGGGFAKGFYAGKLGAARRAFIKVAPDGGATRERQVMRPLFVSESEVEAGPVPLGAVGLDATLPSADVRE